MQLARVMGVIGRVLMTAGVLVLLFVAYQLWGTGLHEARAQNALENEFIDALAAAGVDPDLDPGSETADQPAPIGESSPLPPPPPPEGDAAARLLIPTIGVDKVVVEGVSVSDLKRGPGHYPDSPMPGQPGNAAVAGHRTTYGAPFHRLDELEVGDEMLVTTLQGSFRYTVSEQLIVSPDQVEVLDDFGDNRLTLTACHPKYSARQRIIVVGTLDEAPAPAPEPDPQTDSEATPEEPRATATASLDGGLSGERATAWPAVLLGVACGLIWLAAWVASQLIKKWVAYAVGAPIFFVVLFFFYESFYRLLPANF
jgi:sortase A